MIAQFALRLVCGMSLMWAVMPRNEVTSGFFRIQMLVVLGLSVLASLTFGKFIAPDHVGFLHGIVAQAACAVLATIAYAGSMLWTLERRSAGSVLTLVLAAGSTGVVMLTTATADSLGTLDGSIGLLSEISTSLILGAAMVGMLLGHWYLTAPTMSIEPLNRLTWYLGIAGGVRLSISAVALSVYLESMTTTTHWIWIALRWTAGIAGPLIVFVMVIKILKFRNTQSATGVLFVGVILTFIGEMTAALLHRELGIWL